MIIQELAKDIWENIKEIESAKALSFYARNLHTLLWKEVINMKVIYEYSGCQDVRFFKDEKEFNEWLTRQIIVQPDIKIIETVKES